MVVYYTRKLSAKVTCPGVASMSFKWAAPLKCNLIRCPAYLVKGHIGSLPPARPRQSKNNPPHPCLILTSPLLTSDTKAFKRSFSQTREYSNTPHQYPSSQETSLLSFAHPLLAEKLRSKPEMIPPKFPDLALSLALTFEAFNICGEIHKSEACHLFSTWG